MDFLGNNTDVVFNVVHTKLFKVPLSIGRSRFFLPDVEKKSLDYEEYNGPILCYLSRGMFTIHLWYSVETVYLNLLEYAWVWVHFE